MTSRGAARPNGQAQASKICQFKLVLLGESAVGKSSLVLRFVKGQFHEYQESTIGGESAAAPAHGAHTEASELLEPLSVRVLPRTGFICFQHEPASGSELVLAAVVRG